MRSGAKRAATANRSRRRPDGLPHAGGGLSLRPRDIAKLGAVVLDQGRWQGRTTVQPEWIGLIIIAASGAMGQWIFVIPSARLIVVVTSDDDSRFTAPVEFLSSHLLPSVR